MKVKWKGDTDFLVLTHDQVYDVLSVENGWYRIFDDSGEDYLYPPEQFETLKCWENDCEKRTGAKYDNSDIKRDV